MSRRRGLALVMTAIWVVMTSAVAASPAGAVSTDAYANSIGSSSSGTCVGLVLDERSLGGSVSTDCAKVGKSATGVDVLSAAGHEVGFRSDGLICTIDGLPKSGCSGVNDTHYWAYFHRAPGSTHWVYSSEGASSYQPTACSTEGWVYDDGKALTPDNVAVPGICTVAAKPTATPTPKPTHQKTAAAHPAATPTSPASTTAAAIATPTPATRLKRHHSGNGNVSHTTATTIVGPPPTLSRSPAPSPSSLAAHNAASSSGSGGHGTRTLITWLIVAAALIAMAVILLRNRRRT